MISDTFNICWSLKMYSNATYLPTINFSFQPISAQCTGIIPPSCFVMAPERMNKENGITTRTEQESIEAQSSSSEVRLAHWWVMEGKRTLIFLSNKYE